MNEKLKNLNKKQFEKCLISLEMLTFETPKIYQHRPQEILINASVIQDSEMNE